MSIPTARGHLPKGTTTRSRAIAHSRLAKAIATAMALYTEFDTQATPAMIERLTDADYARAANAAGVHPPNSETTRAQVRLLLRILVALGTTEGADEADVISALLAAPSLKGQPSLVALLVPVA
ncbi:hypothetical protein ABR738_00700 [Streptomyces sp. Edi4]|uniref:hypothetical protein n=1 Tax=Streptomyces sp. Edi4 TaxID=3162527 RepID=UPI003305F589